MSENNEKQRKKWKAHLNDILVDDEGKYSYQGDYYELTGDAEYVNKRALLSVTIMMGLLILAGMFPATGAMDTWYVLFPYAAAIVFSGFLTFYTIRWRFNGVGRLREYVYRKTAQRLPAVSLGSLISAILTLLMEILHLSIFGMGKYPKGAIILIICVFLTAIVAYSLYCFLKGQEWLKMERKGDN